MIKDFPESMTGRTCFVFPLELNKVETVCSVRWREGIQGDAFGSGHGSLGLRW